MVRLSAARCISYLVVSFRERVYIKKTSELVTDGSVTSLKFSLDGKYLSIGFSNGTLILLDIEFGQIFEKSLASMTDGRDIPCSIQQLWWVSLPGEPSPSPIFDTLKWEELFEKESTDNEALSMRRYFQQLDGCVLIALLSNQVICVLSYGIEVVWKSQLPNISGQVTTPFILEDNLFIHIQGEEWDLQNNVKIFLLSGSFIRHSLELKRLACISLMVSMYQKRLEDVVPILGRKWKDAVKTVPPKISLLQSLLTGYEMKMSPVEFLHSVTLCGLWHPAALTTFSQHWNDQGITRLRSSVDSTTKYVIRCLQFKVLPMIFNTMFLVK